MSALTNHVVHQGLDVRAEFKRLTQLKAFHDEVRYAPPPLEITIFRSRRPTRMGGAWKPYWKWPKGRIKINLHADHGADDVRETLIHELAHMDMFRRFPDVRVQHGEPFWVKLDQAFAEAYPGAETFLAPRKDRYHGRYAMALKRFALFGNEPFDAELWKLNGILGQVTSEKMINGTLVQTIRELQPAAVDAKVIPIRPQAETPVRGTKINTGTLDERVFRIVKLDAGYGISREDIGEHYEREHGEYPGKSVYNSLWRLRRDGRVERIGHLWYAK